MREPVESPANQYRHNLDIEALRTWVERQRWYASQRSRVTGIEIGEGAVSEDPPLFLALVQTAFATGNQCELDNRRDWVPIPIGGIRWPQELT